MVVKLLLVEECGVKSPLKRIVLLNVVKNLIKLKNRPG